LLGVASLAVGFSSIGLAVRLVRRLAHHHAPRTEMARQRLSHLRRMWALLVAGSGAGFIGLAFMLTYIHHWFITPERSIAIMLLPIGLISMLVGSALLLATTVIYVLGRNRLRSTSTFSSGSVEG
jgi:protease PrsW